jgi:hypothetical protein
MNSPEATPTSGPVVQLGEDIDPTVADYVRAAMAIGPDRGRSSSPTHVRIIRDHDPALARPVIGRAIMAPSSTRAPLRVLAATPREAVDMLADRMRSEAQPAGV